MLCIVSYIMFYIIFYINYFTLFYIVCFKLFRFGAFSDSKVGSVSFDNLRGSCQGGWVLMPICIWYTILVAFISHQKCLFLNNCNDNHCN